MPKTTGLSRRSFLKTATAATVLTTLPAIVRGQTHRHRANLAFVGVGGQGKSALSSLEGENFVAFCDVDEARATSSFEAYPHVKRFRDFRVMLDAVHRDIDGVVICTPDHTHFAAAYLAMQHGKAVFVEKPLTHNIWQARTLAKAADKYGVVTQMGNQGHATEGIRFVKEWYDAGILGEVKEVHAWFDGPTFGDNAYFRIPDRFRPRGGRPPATLDWDLWLGPSPKQKYSGYYVPKTWRGFWEFGSGELGDWACHTLDAPYWALDLGAPTRVSVIERDVIHRTFVPRSSHILFEFPARGEKPPVKLHWYDGGKLPPLPPKWDPREPLPKAGMMMIGSKETLITGPRPNSPQLVLPNDDWIAFRKNMPAKTIPRVMGGPHQEWIRAVKGEGPLAGSQFSYSAGLTEMSLVGVLAQKTGRTIEWDAKAMRVTNQRGFENLVKEPARKGWDVGAEVWRV